MNIIPINGFSQPKNVSSKGLTKCLKNRIFLDGQKDISVLLDKHPDNSCITGQLPRFMINKLPKENRKEAIAEIYAAFGKITTIIRDYVPTGDAFIFNPSLKHRPSEVNDILTNVLRKYKILKPYDDDIDIQYIDQGGKGKVFKLQGLYDRDNEDEFVIKIFHQIKGKEWHPFKSHGCYAEINNATYWRNQEGLDTHRGKFYFADLKSGYIVSKFLDEDVPIPKRVVDEYKYGIKCTDEEKNGPINGYNRIKGYNYDYGGMRVVNRLKNMSSEVRKYLKIIRDLPIEKRTEYWISNFYQKQATLGKKAGLTLGIKHFDEKSYFLDEVLSMNNYTLNQAAAYVLKYLPHNESVAYFKKLMQTKDVETQRILLNEIPLLSKKKNDNIRIHDDINVALQEIIPERVYTYYKIAEEFVLPESVEHLASFVHLLPRNKIKEQYAKLISFNNTALQERLIWKASYLPEDMRNFAMRKLIESVKQPILRQRLSEKVQNNEELSKYALEKFSRAE